MKERQRYNRKILDAIAEISEMYPNLRFNQILALLNLTDRDAYYQESKVTYTILSEVVKKMRQRIVIATLERLLERT
jgi:hypothetical protein